MFLVHVGLLPHDSLSARLSGPTDSVLGSRRGWSIGRRSRCSARLQTATARGNGIGRTLCNGFGEVSIASPAFRSCRGAIVNAGSRVICRMQTTSASQVDATERVVSDSGEARTPCLERETWGTRARGKSQTWATRPRTLKGCVLLWFPFRNGKVAAQEPKSPVFPLAA